MPYPTGCHPRANICGRPVAGSHVTSLCDDNTLLGKVKTMYSVISSMSQQTITPRPAEAAPARVSGLSAGLLALAAGIAAFLLGTVIVTELVTPRIEFSLFVGLPVGFVVGVVTAVLVGGGLSRAAGRRYRLALGGGVAGIAFLVVGVGGAALASVSLGLLAGVTIAAVAFVVTVLRG